MRPKNNMKTENFLCFICIYIFKNSVFCLFAWLHFRDRKERCGVCGWGGGKGLVGVMGIENVIWVYF